MGGGVVNTCGSFAILRISLRSSSLRACAAISSSFFCTKFASTTVENTGKPLLRLSELSRLHVYTPVTSISSPGRATSMRSHRSTTSLWRGRRPAGTEPGDSCSVSFW